MQLHLVILPSQISLLLQVAVEVFLVTFVQSCICLFELLNSILYGCLNFQKQIESSLCTFPLGFELYNGIEVFLIEVRLKLVVYFVVLSKQKRVNGALVQTKVFDKFLYFH